MSPRCCDTHFRFMNTSRLAIIFLLGLLLASACGCGRSRLHAELDLADSLAEHAGPDSAARVLLELKPLMADAPDDVAMRWRLLMVKAADKAYITHTSDSMLRPALDYYTHRTSDTLRPEAFYYAGRVYSDMGDYPRALDYFGRALLAMSSDENIGFQACIHARMRDLYLSQFFYTQALNHAQTYKTLTAIKNDTSSVIEALKKIGQIYMYMEKSDSAEKSFVMAKEMANVYGDKALSDNLELEYVYLSIKSGDFYRADSILRSLGPISTVLSTEEDVRNAVLACLYLNREEWDSCIYYSNLRVESGTPYGRMFGHNGLAQCYLHLKNPEKAIEHIEAYHHLLDSLRLTENRELMLRTESSYNYSLHERENIELQAEGDRLRRTIFALIALLSIFLSLGLIIYYRQRSRTYRMELEKLRMEKTMDELEDENRKLGRESIELRSEMKKLVEARTDRELSAQEAILRIKSLLEGSRVDKMTDPDWSSLEEALDEVLPGFCTRLRALGLTEREYRVSLLARLDLGNKSISVLIGASAHGVGMARLRLSRKYGKGDRSADWDEFLRSF